MENLSNSKSALQYRLQASDQVKAVSKDFLTSLGITEFVFIRFNSNGQHIDLSTSKKWVKFFFENKNLDISVVDNMWGGSDNTMRFWIWPEPSSEKTDLFRALNEHNLFHGLTVFEKKDGLLSMWAFATAPDNPGIKETYLNHRNDFQSFSREFCERGSELIKNCVATNTMCSEKKLLKSLHNPVLDANIDRFERHINGKSMLYQK